MSDTARVLHLEFYVPVPDDLHGDRLDQWMMDIADMPGVQWWTTERVGLPGKDEIFAGGRIIDVDDIAWCTASCKRNAKAMIITAIIETVNALRGTTVPVEGHDAGAALMRAAEHADRLLAVDPWAAAEEPAP